MRAIPLCLAIALLAAADPPPAKPAADPAFEARPGRLGMTRYRHWQNDGVHSNDQREFSATIRFFAKGDVTVLGWRDLKITSAVSDAGEELEYKPSGNREGRVDADMRRMRGFETDAAQFEADCAFAWPAKPCNGIAKLTGTVTALLAVGNPKKAELKPYKAVLGKTLEIGGIPGGEMTVDKAEAGEGVTLRYPRAMQDKILGVTFLDAAGKEMRMNGWGGGSNGDDIERTYRIRMPDEGAIVVSIMPESRAVEVPFSISDMTMAMDGGGAKPRTRMKVEVKDDVPAPAKPDAEKLPVKPVGGPDNKF